MAVGNAEHASRVASTTVLSSSLPSTRNREDLSPQLTLVEPGCRRSGRGSPPTPSVVGAACVPYPHGAADAARDHQQGDPTADLALARARRRADLLGRGSRRGRSGRVRACGRRGCWGRGSGRRGGATCRTLQHRGTPDGLRGRCGGGLRTLRGRGGGLRTLRGRAGGELRTLRSRRGGGGGLRGAVRAADARAGTPGPAGRPPRAGGGAAAGTARAGTEGRAGVAPAREGKAFGGRAVLLVHRLSPGRRAPIGVLREKYRLAGGPIAITATDRIPCGWGKAPLAVRSPRRHLTPP